MLAWLEARGVGDAIALYAMDAATRCDLGDECPAGCGELDDYTVTFDAGAGQWTARSKGDGPALDTWTGVRAADVAGDAQATLARSEYVLPLIREYTRFPPGAAIGTAAIGAVMQTRLAAEPATHAGHATAMGQSLLFFVAMLTIALTAATALHRTPNEAPAA